MKYILMVNENDSSLNTCVARLLQDTAVLHANNLEEASNLIEKTPDEIVCIFADYDVCSANKKDFINNATANAIPCVALLEDGCREEIIAEVFSNGAIDYIIKDDSNSNCKYIARMTKRLQANTGIKILVASSYQPAMQDTIDILIKHKYMVLTTGDGVSALEIFDEHPDIKIVIIDQNIPLISGLGLVSSLRYIYPEDQLSVIGVSDEANDRLATSFIKAGANDFLKMPFRPEELAARVMHNLEMLEHIDFERKLATVDHLTGLYNKRFFLEMAEKTLAKSKRSKSSLVMASFEISNFRFINVEYGHVVTNKILQKMANILTLRLRNSDIVARVDSNKFCVLAVDMKHTLTDSIFGLLLDQMLEVRIDTNRGEIGFNVVLNVTTDFKEPIENIIESSNSIL